MNSTIDKWSFKQGKQEAKEEFEKMIIEWQKVPCIDGKEKCHECINELLTKIKEMGEKDNRREWKW